MGKWGHGDPAMCLYMCISGAFDRAVRVTEHLHTERYNASMPLSTDRNCANGEGGKEVDLGKLGQVG